METPKMKLTKEQLKAIIKEEVANMEESAHGGFRGYTGPEEEKPMSQSQWNKRAAERELARKRKELDNDPMRDIRIANYKRKEQEREEREAKKEAGKKELAQIYKKHSDAMVGPITKLFRFYKVRSKKNKDLNIAAPHELADAIGAALAQSEVDGYYTAVIPKNMREYFKNYYGKNAGGPPYTKEEARILSAILKSLENKIPDNIESSRASYSPRIDINITDEYDKMAKAVNRYQDSRSFMQKAGSFLTGKGYNEGITKEDIQKMVQEELEAVTKGN